MSTSNKRKLKRLLRAYLNQAGHGYQFVRVSDARLRQHLGVDSSGWDPLTAYYVKSCLVDQYLGLDHNLYPESEIFELDSTKPLVEKFGLFPIADLAGAQVALRLADGEVFEIAIETFTMDFWDGQVDGVHETSLIDYVQTLVEGVEEDRGYEPTIPDEIRLAHLQARTEKEIAALSETKQASLLKTTMDNNDLELARRIIKVAGFSPGCRVEAVRNRHFLDYFGNRCNSVEMVELLVKDLGFRFHKINLKVIAYFTKLRPDLLPEFIRHGAFVKDTWAYRSIYDVLERRNDPLIKELP